MTSHQSDACAPPPATSPDGRFWWNGDKWVPFAQMPTESAPRDSADLATGVAGGLGKFILGLLLIPLALVLIPLVLAGAGSGAFGYVLVPVLLAGGLAFWYFKRLR